MNNQTNPGRFYGEDSANAFTKIMFGQMTWQEYEEIWNKERDAYIKGLSSRTGIASDRIRKLLDAAFSPEQIEAMIETGVLA